MPIQQKLTPPLLFSVFAGWVNPSIERTNNFFNLYESSTYWEPTVGHTDERLNNHIELLRDSVIAKPVKGYPEKQRFIYHSITENAEYIGRIRPSKSVMFVFCYFREMFFSSSGRVHHIFCTLGFMRSFF